MSLVSVLVRASEEVERDSGQKQTPAGSFQMGGTASFNEQPIHKVSLKTFALGKTEVTQWKTLMGADGLA